MTQKLVAVTKQRKRLNVPLLRDIQKLLRRKPEKADMANWVEPMDPNEIYDANDGRGDSRRFVPICETYLCIGGAALMISGTAKLKIKREKGYDGIDGLVLILTESKKPIKDPALEAAAVLGLTPAQRRNLFYKPNWPKRFIEKYGYLGTEADRMIARIDYLIETGK